MKLEECLVVIACKEESEDLFEKLNTNLIFTGVGKVNATYYLTKKLQEIKPKLVLNFGSAGSKKYQKKSLVYSNKFIQRDMDATIFGYEKYVTPSDNFPLILEHKNLINDLSNGVCGSGDNFVTTQEIDAKIDLVDMEGYALARVCKLENVDFVSVKYITDGLDKNGGNEWKNEVRSSAKIMYDYFLKLLENLK
jgi:adenosylhomocysteine nucleosidase